MIPDDPHAVHQAQGFLRRTSASEITTDDLEEAEDTDEKEEEEGMEILEASTDPPPAEASETLRDMMSIVM
nr:hypothetical protein BaRGS_011662 [Batillaria attramentaria]